MILLLPTGRSSFPGELVLFNCELILRRSSLCGSPVRSGLSNILTGWFYVCTGNFHGTRQAFMLIFQLEGTHNLIHNKNVDSTTTYVFKFLAGDFFHSRQASSLFCPWSFSNLSPWRSVMFMAPSARFHLGPEPHFRPAVALKSEHPDSVAFSWVQKSH